MTRPARDLAYDCAGNLYIAGRTRSNDFSTTLGGPGGNVDVFVVKLDLGGALGDAVEGVAVAPDDRVIVSGGSFSANFPTAGAPHQATAGGYLDAFLAILSADLTTLEYASFVGGSNWDVARAVAVGPSGQIAATGETRSNDLPTTPGAFDMSFGGGQEFDTIVVQLVP